MGEGTDQDAVADPLPATVRNPTPSGSPAPDLTPDSNADPGLPEDLAADPWGERAPVAVGTAVWALLFAIGLFIRDDLVDSGRGWWVWAAASGVVLGVGGYAYLRRRHARLLNRRTPGPS